MSNKSIIGTRTLIGVVILLIINLPIVTALEISNLHVEEITQNSAVIAWETDQPADSFVYYGNDPNNFQSKGDADSVLSHQINVDTLTPATEYKYYVRSDEIIDNNAGNFYSFMTLAPDITIPTINVTLPEVIKGKEIDVRGTTEIGSRVDLLVNQQLAASTTAANGNFVFNQIVLRENEQNNVTITVIDTVGNVALFTTIIFADTTQPRIELIEIPDFTDKNSISVAGTISETAKYDISVNNRSVKQGEGTTIKEDLQLEEGENRLIISAHDTAGWTDQVEVSITSDTQPPTVTAQIERGLDYYEGRAESDIDGKTEPKAKAFLYVYKPLGYEYKPDFENAREVVTADEDGTFKFDDVDFSASIFDSSIDVLKPKEVPSGLQDYTIFKTADLEAAQSSNYHIFIIVEDRAGRTAYWQQTVNVHTCFSQDLDFSVQSLPKFQAPLRLVPQLLDEGRQEIQTVFELKYLGQGLPKIVNGEEVEKGAKVTRVTFERACTPGMAKDDKFSIGCKIFPPNGQKNLLQNGDGSAVYVTWNLASTSDLSKRKPDFWNDFKKRQVVFPIKMRIDYQERIGDNKYGPVKKQTVCTDLGYFVDIPLESDELIPDFLADEGVDALDYTIKQLQTIRPYLERAFLVAGISCMGSWMFRTVARWSRIFTSNMEHYYSWVKSGLKAQNKDDPDAQDKNTKVCPTSYRQNKLYFKEEVDNWLKLDKNNIPIALKNFQSVDDPNLKPLLLEERCPKTAGAWKFETAIDKAYKFTCNRAFCRTTPARWTEDKEIEDINEVILKQQQCAVTARGIPLQRIENCKEQVKENIAHIDASVIQKVEDNGGVCWRTADQTLYYFDQKNEKNKNDYPDAQKGIFRLSPIPIFLSDVKLPEKEFLVYRPDGSDTFIIGKDENCEQACSNKRKVGYKPDTVNGYEKGCYDEKLDKDGLLKLYDQNRKVLNEKDAYSAGYNNDCFLKKNVAGNIETDGSQPVFQQCVCLGKKEEEKKYKNDDLTLRTADPKKNNQAEDWFYHQERVFVESKKTLGTYYPEVRYYAGRDFLGAFGTDNVLDYIKPGDPEIPDINPHSQIIGAFQTVCLSSILKNMRMLEGMLVGVRNCLVEAKFTGLHDAGACKTLFTQQVCGLIYKGIGYLFNNCNSNNFDDVGKEGAFGDVGVIVSEGFDSMNQAMESSVQDIKDDYGNAALNEYFKGGAQGFAQSICLAAFGYEFPLLSDEFLLDAAYAVPTKTTVLMVPKERELSSYNPALQTAVFNYNIGGIIFPGCRIRNWKVSLKCIGPEDRGRPGIDESCGGKGCDCLNTQQPNSPLEGEKTKLLMSGYEIPSGNYFSIPLASPQKIDSHYRYDHVVVELQLDPTEAGNEDKCFDDGYHNGLTGLFYEPIIDVSPPGELNCRVDLVYGRYVCPELATLFGFGGAYFEEPYVDCYDDKTDNWVSCATPDLFTEGDIIATRVHVNLDEKGKCLRTTVRNVPGIAESVRYPLNSGMAGPSTRPINLGTVRADMFGGSVVKIIKNRQTSNANCNDNPALLNTPTDTLPVGTQFPFAFEPAKNNLMKLKVPGQVTLTQKMIDANFGINSDRYLTSGGSTDIQPEIINQVEFDAGGFIISQVLGSALPGQGQNQCTYQIAGGSGTASSLQNFRDINVMYELLEHDEGGGCFLATQPVKESSAVQPTKKLQTIRVQLKPQVSDSQSGLLAVLNFGNLDALRTMATDIIQRGGQDLNHALATYYLAAGYIVKGGGVTTYKTEITNALRLFFDRKWGTEQFADFDLETQKTLEFQKIKAYMCEIAKKEIENNQVLYNPPAGKCTA